MQAVGPVARVPRATALACLLPAIVAVVGAACSGTVLFAQSSDSSAALSLDQTAPPKRGTNIFSEQEQAESRSARVAPSSWVIEGPISLRSADPYPVGTFVIKNAAGWSTAKDHHHDRYQDVLTLEYGVVENHEVILDLPVALGDGRVPGNGDLSAGWHWRLTEEQDWLPAMALRNTLRVPSGSDSSGLDYELRGLFTKTIVPERLRAHFNPFIKSVNGDNREDARHFQWGGLVGLDYRVSEIVLLAVDYSYRARGLEGTRDQHAMEVGCEWAITPRQTLGFAAEIGLDGDGQGPAFGTKVSYIISIE